MNKKNFGDKLGVTVQVQDAAVQQRFDNADSVLSRLSGNPPGTGESKKTAVVRQTFSMSPDDYDILTRLHQAAVHKNHKISASEIIRIGIRAIAVLDGDQMVEAASKLERLRPVKRNN